MGDKVLFSNELLVEDELNLIGDKDILKDLTILLLKVLVEAMGDKYNFLKGVFAGVGLYLIGDDGAGNVVKDIKKNTSLIKI